MNSAILCMLGLISVFLFYAGSYPPVWISVSVFLCLTIFFINQFRKKNIGLLILVFWVVYALPFIHILPYIWFDFNSEPLTLWGGLMANPYMTDKPVIELMGMLGASGGLGMALGVSFTKPRHRPINYSKYSMVAASTRTLYFPIWLMWIGLGLFLTVIGAPRETIFEAAYTTSSSSLDGANFGSSWMVSYVLLTFAFLDALLEHGHIKKKLKTRIIGSVILLIVVWYQLLRGDRESLPWVFGLALAYFYWASDIARACALSIHWPKILLVGILIYFTSFLIGQVRSGFDDTSLLDAFLLVYDRHESDSMSLDNLFRGTWSAALLSPLSVAGDYIYDSLNMGWGQTYFDLLLSVPPGFLADAIGYIRPINENQGPAWEMRYGIGGTHAVVVPFMNFRMIGVLLVPAGWTYLLVLLERGALRSPNIYSISLLVSLVSVAPHWLWYGEKALISSISIWFICSFLFRISLGLSRLKNKRAPRRNLPLGKFR